MREESDSDFVYNPESPWGSPVPLMHTRSMGSPPPPDDSDSDGPVDVPNPKWKWCKQKPRIFKEKQYKIHQGSCMNKKQCPWCHEVFNSQLELNCHTENDQKSNLSVPNGPVELNLTLMQH